MTTLLTVSIIGGIMILVITALRALLQNRLHRTVFLLLWLLAALRLAVPAVLPSIASVYNFLPNDEGNYRIEYYGGQAEVPDFGMAQDPALVYSEALSSQEAPTVVYPAHADPVYVENHTSVDIATLMRWIWIGGSCLCFLYFVWIHVRARLRYRFALPEEGPEFLGRIRLKRSDEISAPLVYGFFHPVILLPVDFPEKDTPEYEQVLHHELTHVRSGDLWFKLGMLLVTCVHWFNPLVWLMLHLSTQDLEIRCDARVIRKLGQKKIYAMTLVQAEAKRSYHFAEAAFAFSLTELRLKSIAKAKVYLPRSIVICTVLAVVLVCCFSTGPRAEAVPMEEPEPATAETTAFPETLPITDTEQPEEETKPAPPPTICIDEAAELEYLLSCGYEEYGSVMEVPLREGERKTLALRLPEYATFSMDPSGKDMLSLAGEYSHDEELYYLTLVGLDEGEAEIYISVAGRAWMRLRVEIRFDLYYSIPDAAGFEPYGSSFSASITSRDSKNISLKLPERATYVYDVQQDGESIPYYYLSTYQWYDKDNGIFHLIMTPEILSGNAVFYFYVDGIYWCKLDVSIRVNSGSSQSSGSSNIKFNGNYNNYNNGHYNNSGNSSSGIYDYLSQQGPQPAIPGYSGSTGSNNGPIIVWAPIFTGNGGMIQPGIYWPGD